MPGKIHVKTLLLCGLLAARFPLWGQTVPPEETAAEAGTKARAEAGTQTHAEARTEQLNRLPPRARYFAFESLDKAIEGDREASDRFVSLNGPWKFYPAEKEKSVPGNFYRTDFTDSGWDKIQVPRVNEPAGKESPAALYRKKFRLSESWTAKQVFISLRAAGPAFMLWVNGQPAGRAQYDAGDAEFNISALVQPGENLLAIRVDGCGGDDSPGCPGDISGMNGDVFLYSRPAVHFWDLTIKSRLDKNHRNGILEMEVQVENRMDSVKERFWGVLKEPLYSKARVRAQLFNEDGKNILDFNGDELKQVRGRSDISFSFKGEIENVEAWSHETPHLYRLDIALMNESGQVLEAVSRRIGFRTAETENGRLLVNGTPVLLKAFKPDTRQLLSADKEEMQEEIRRIKQGNYNIVYSVPDFNHPYWYELCDRYGIYIAGEEGRGNKNNPSVIPGLSEEYQVVKQGQQNVGLQLLDFLKSTIRVSNKYAFRDLSNHYLQWEVLVNGKTREEGRIDELEAGPGEEARFTLGYKTRFYPGNDYFLNLKIKTKTEEPMIPKDFTIVSRQFRLSPYQYEETYEVDKGLIDVSDQPGRIILNGYDFRIEFDKSSGQISRYSYKGKELMNGGPELTFGKQGEVGNAAHNAQGARAAGEATYSPESAPAPGTAGQASPVQILEDSLRESRAVWNAAFEKGNLIGYKVTEDVNGNYYIAFTTSMIGGNARLFQKFRVDGRGAILVENVFVKMEGTYPDMPRFGTSFELPYDYERIEWYGREPEQGNAVGIWSGLVDAQSSSKTDVRWVRLTRKDGYGFEIRKENELFGLTAAQDREGKGPVLLSIDLSQTPVPFKSYDFIYRIIPYAFSATAQ